MDCEIIKKTKIIFCAFVTTLILFSLAKNVIAQKIIIGKQTWATTNLDATTFRNGDTIPEVKTNSEWVKAGNEKKPAWCYYDNDPINGKKYGRIYNWYAVIDERGLAPKGWHLPSDTDWTTLSNYLGGVELAGNKMKSTTGWDEYKGRSGNGTNISGFTGLPGGCRYEDGTFSNIRYLGGWWSSTPSDIPNYFIYYTNTTLDRLADGKLVAFYIRCLAD